MIGRGAWAAKMILCMVIQFSNGGHNELFKPEVPLPTDSCDMQIAKHIEIGDLATQIDRSFAALSRASGL
jgi:hypothetical protein